MRNHDIIHWYVFLYPKSGIHVPTDEVNYKAKWQKVELRGSYNHDFPNVFEWSLHV